MSNPRAPFSPRTAISIVLLLGVVFAANHIAARIAFDHGTGLVTAVLIRSGVTALALLGAALWLGVSLRLSAYAVSWRWMLTLCALIATQSLLLYSAVARIPVGLALLVFNLFPALFILLNWAMGGPKLTTRVAGIIAVILLGLALALDLRGQLARPGVGSAQFWAGVGFGLGAATVFAVALNVTQSHLNALHGVARSFWTMAGVTLLLGSLCLAAWTGLGGEVAQAAVLRSMHWPSSWIGWLGLAGLTLCYGSAFSLLFALMPRLDMARHAPASNIEPVAALLLGWLLLGQAMSSTQYLGAAVVLAGVIALAWRGKK